MKQKCGAEDTKKKIFFFVIFPKSSLLTSLPLSDNTSFFVCEHVGYSYVYP